ncbi:hypothetical protein [Bacillus salipaludis]|uniref:Uncharacterized protein n=1 Tax=Bacillus salipaludis TaxID=2547811 RepID=A0AA90TRU5_9BACI|nr:hypothetical protein [Bacillus salipaludis]MDQ6600286.1 hypothetical protein [Bacillus salipaludis]
MEMVFMRSMKAKKEREFHGNGFHGSMKAKKEREFLGNGFHEVDEGEKREGVSWKWFS